MVFDQIDLGGANAATDLAEKFPRLVLELVEARADGLMACGHDKPPTVSPSVRTDGREGGSHQP
jgi:hypothetical protein